MGNLSTPEKLQGSSTLYFQNEDLILKPLMKDRKKF